MKVTEKIEGILTNKLPCWWSSLTLRKQDLWTDVDLDYGTGDESDEEVLDEFMEFIKENPAKTVSTDDVMEANLISSMTATSTFWLSPEGIAKKAETAAKREENPKGYYSDYVYPFGSSVNIPEGGWHMPVIDLDMDAKLVTSSSGNNHLFIDKKMSWETYKNLLQALADAGLVQQGYVDASIARGQSDARLPWIQKGEEMEGYPDDDTEDEVEVEEVVSPEVR